MNGFSQGLFLTLGLIATIGVQNTLLIKQGLLRQHVFALASAFFLCDVVLISLGVYGLGSLLAQSVWASFTLAVLGSVFLLVYGGRAAQAAWRGGMVFATDNSSPKQSRGKVVALALAVSLLNPHVYLDTVVIIGGVAGTLSEQDKFGFLIGSLSASGLWFYGVGFGARLLIPFFRKEIMWRILDGITFVVMWAIAYSMLSYALELLPQLS